MKTLLIFAFAFCFTSLSAQNEVFEDRELGSICFQFDNFNKSKHGKYSANIELQSNDVFSRHSSNLEAMISEGNIWTTQIPLGSYNITIRLRSNYSLTVCQVHVSQEKTPTININMHDVQNRFRRTSITREFREPQAQ